MQRSQLLALLASCGVVAAAAAQTVTVTTLHDVVDFGGQRQVGDLPGPDGKISFREALAATNNTSGPQTVEFAIPVNEWWLVDDMALLRIEGIDPFQVTDDQTTVDFSTQTDYTGDTNPDGMEVGIYGVEPNGTGTPAIIVTASDCVFRGLGQVWRRSSSISVWGGHNHRFVGNVTNSIKIDPGIFGTTSTGNVIGGTAPVDANDLGSVILNCGASDNLVIGNRLSGVIVAGYSNCGSPPARNRIGGPTPEERNVINDFGTYGHEGRPVGAGVHVWSAQDTLVEGNYIGVSEDGMSDEVVRGPTGVKVADSVNTTIRGNLIAGMRVVGANHYAGQLFGQGILVTTNDADDVGTVIENNMIGTDATGLNPINTLNGIVVESVTYDDVVRQTRIGGLEPGQANLIAFTEQNGVVVIDPSIGIEISGNSIHSNGRLGIDLGTWFDGADGVTQNDPGDADTEGGNELQNYPVLTEADTTGSTLHVRGSLNSHPDTLYRIEFFANGACDPSGHGEGERFAGSVEVTTDSAGDAPFDTALNAVVQPGEFITATATAVTLGATSEFSACIETSDGGCAADFNGDGTVNTQDVLSFLNAWAAGDPLADFNDDGVINTQDVLAFLNAWTAGC